MLTSAGYIVGGKNQPKQVQSILVCIMCVVPFAVSMFSFFVALSYPIDDVVHWKIVEGLERLKSFNQDEQEKVKDGSESGEEGGGEKENEQQKYNRDNNKSVAEPITGGKVYARRRQLIKEQDKKEFVMDSFLLSTVINSKVKSQHTFVFSNDIALKEKLRTGFWGCGIVLGLFLYCFFVNFRALTDANSTKKSLMSGHHCINTVAAVLLVSLSVLMFVFHWLRLEPAEVLMQMDSATLTNYVQRKNAMNGRQVWGEEQVGGSKQAVGSLSEAAAAAHLRVN